MSDLYELLAPYFDVPEQSSSSLPPPTANDLQTTSYLNRLSTLSIGDLTTTEPASLLHAAQSHLRNLQALSKRSHKAVITSCSHLANLTSLLPNFGTQATELKDEVPLLEREVTEFAKKYDRSTENAVLDRRKRAMLLSRNVDRVSDVLELPSLLSSSVTAAQALSTGSATGTSTAYSQALDLHAHIKRLNALYPHLELVTGISKQAEAEIQNLATILIMSLQSASLKLTAAMRTVGWLKRVAPDLAEDDRGSQRPIAVSIKSLNLSSSATSADGVVGSLFLVCRLRMLNSMLDALEPLRDLADEETARRKQTVNGVRAQQQPQTSAVGSQSERYLKRYIEIFREQSFAIISMYKSVFPAGLPAPAGVTPNLAEDRDPLLPLASPISSFAMHLVEMLMATLREYLPAVTEKSARESLLTQVLYCAGSLGRLGADFGMMTALLEEELVEAEHGEVSKADQDPEWVLVMQKHRIQVSRLEVLARGVGRKGSIEVTSPSAAASPAG